MKYIKCFLLIAFFAVAGINSIEAASQRDVSEMTCDELKKFNNKSDDLEKFADRLYKRKCR